MQFHVRDAAAADEDLRAAARPVDGDAARCCSPATGAAPASSARPTTTPRVVEELLGPVPLAGAFCAGEIGPVGGRNFLHGFTASVAVFG